MSLWNANFVNDPNDDFNLIVEIIYKDNCCAIIRQSVEGLELEWISDTIKKIPVNWLLDVLKQAKTLEAIN